MCVKRPTQGRFLQMPAPEVLVLARWAPPSRRSHSGEGETWGASPAIQH